MALSTQEASAILASAIHLCNRQKGSGATRATLAKLLEDEKPLARTQSMPEKAQIQNDDQTLVKVNSAPCQTIYRGRWADLEDDSE